jgi:hypothetical protein
MRCPGSVSVLSSAAAGVFISYVLSQTFLIIFQSYNTPGGIMLNRALFSDAHIISYIVSKSAGNLAADG